LLFTGCGGSLLTQLFYRIASLLDEKILYEREGARNLNKPESQKQ
jgi:hypothetical protein